MVWPAVIAGVASLVGGYLANQASAKQAAIARDEAGRYSGTAHQREVTDLRAAGLNPILSGTGGAGASTPSGMVAQQHDIGTSAAQTFLSAKMAKANINLAKEQKTTAFALGQKHDADRMLVNRQNNILEITENIAQWNEEVEKLRVPGNKDEARFWSSEDYATKRRLDALSDTVGRGVGALSPFKGMFGTSARSLKKGRSVLPKGRRGGKRLTDVIP